MRFNHIKGVEILSSEVSDGMMNYNLQEGQRNLDKFLKKHNAIRPLVICSQPHKTQITIVNQAGRIEDADGILTTEDLTLAVKTADCVPLMIYEKESGLIGAIHVSRANLLAGIISNSLLVELEKQSIVISRISVFLGPHIRVENYPQKTEVVKKIKNTRFAKFLKEFDAKVCFDMTTAVVAELETIGLKRENIVDCGIDTFISPEYFSLRKSDCDKDVGVFLTAIFKK